MDRYLHWAGQIIAGSHQAEESNKLNEDRQHLYEAHALAGPEAGGTRAKPEGNQRETIDTPDGRLKAAMSTLGPDGWGQGRSQWLHPPHSFQRLCPLRAERIPAYAWA